MCRISEEWRQEGYEEGREEGRVEGLAEGREENKLEVAANLLKMTKLSCEEIAKIVNLPVEKIRELDTGKSA